MLTTMSAKPGAARPQRDQLLLRHLHARHHDCRARPGLCATSCYSVISSMLATMIARPGPARPQRDQLLLRLPHARHHDCRARLELALTEPTIQMKWSKVHECMSVSLSKRSAQHSKIVQFYKKRLACFSKLTTSNDFYVKSEGMMMFDWDPSNKSQTDVASLTPQCTYRIKNYI
ncbi:Transcription factor MYB14 [Frankliniella fusca]|uniref:Transcription factor MYB14 n=1 Tax=Frankliniella fusca TaxID=407009 RepID=A0AAE1HXI8_9NEOP|nr:Transcription factor MYB14 [Frankliniella fusca]